MATHCSFLCLHPRSRFVTAANPGLKAGLAEASRCSPRLQKRTDSSLGPTPSTTFVFRRIPHRPVYFLACLLPTASPV